MIGIDLTAEIRRKWESNWWLDEKYAEFQEFHGRARVERAMRKVAELFDEQWAERVQSHDFIFNIFAKGLLPLGNLFALGDDLAAVEGSPKLGRVMKDLRGADFLSAHVELLLAAQLARQGHTISFRPPVPGEREADFISAFDSQSVYFESKRMNNPQETVVMQEVTDAVRIGISDLDREFRDGGWGHEIVLEGDVTIRATRTGKETVVSEVVQQIAASLADAKTAGVETYFTIPGIATIQAGPGLPTFDRLAAF